MSSMAKRTNDNVDKLSSKELAALARPARAKSREAKREALERATRGLRVDVRVTPSLYRPR
jgi:hypothetical protein